jgi:phospholipase C
VILFTLLILLSTVSINGSISQQNYVSAQNTTTTTPIKHLIVIFQENISFDHYFATYPNASNSNKSEPQFIAISNTPSDNGGSMRNRSNLHNSISHRFQFWH